MMHGQQSIKYIYITVLILGLLRNIINFLKFVNVYNVYKLI
jgi:hypothetical protein